MAAPVTVNCFLYYGVIVSIGEVHTAMKRVVTNDKDLYDFVYGHGLAFKRIGDEMTGASLVIGRELFAQAKWTGIRFHGNADGVPTVSSLNGTTVKAHLTLNEERDVTRKLCELGFVRAPGYILTHNYTMTKKR